MTEEEEEVSKLVQSRSTESKLNLARLNLRCFPSVYPLTLKQIHLRGNKLTELPGALFVDLPHLVWVDVRDNELRELPQQIEHAANLSDLLLGTLKNFRTGFIDVSIHVNIIKIVYS